MSGHRKLKDLVGVGKAALGDFLLLQIWNVQALAGQDPRDLFDRMCELTHSRQDPCVFDVFACAIAQAKDAELSAAECKWWIWSRIRKLNGPHDLDEAKGGVKMGKRKKENNSVSAVCSPRPKRGRHREEKK
jgi:hypothetical protein